VDGGGLTAIKMKCEGCKEEMEECYFWQNQKGCVAGLDWTDLPEEDGLHCFVFVINEKTGRFIIS